MVHRTLFDRIRPRLGDRKAIVIQGARQTGKTTLIHALLDQQADTLWVNGDVVREQTFWGSNPDPSQLRQYVGGYKYLVIDEAQRINNIGLTIKLIVDGDFSVQPILSGSSSLNLASSINEPLTGRKWSYELYPLTWTELVAHYQFYPSLRELSNRLVTGSYPEVVTQQEGVEQRLEEITSSYLYKDILDYGDIRKPELIVQLLRALAYQLGAKVSYNELSQLLKVSAETVRRYIQLLEESYVIFRLEPLSTNPRKEISTSRKIYFVDNGIRNAVIGNLLPLSQRNDQGQLWENFVVSEVYKHRHHRGQRGSLHFWRSRDGAEVDLIVSQDGDYRAYEIKYNPKKRGRFPTSFMERYRPSVTTTVNRDNFWKIWTD
jgi:predicted AAA+ superfamily ATPase